MATEDLVLDIIQDYLPLRMRKAPASDPSVGDVPVLSAVDASGMQCTFTPLADITGGGASTWGGIVGTMSAQTDLQTALDAKLPLAGGVMSGNLLVKNRYGQKDAVWSGRVSVFALSSDRYPRIGLFYNQTAVDVWEWCWNSGVPAAPGEMPADGDVAASLNAVTGDIVSGFTHTHNEYAPAAHTHTYLPLAGGALTGALTISSTNNIPATFVGISAVGYSEIHIDNDLGYSTTLGSIGSEYVAEQWAGSAYLYTTTQEHLWIKSGKVTGDMGFFTGGTALANKRLSILADGQIIAYGNVTLAKSWPQLIVKNTEYLLSAIAYGSILTFHDKAGAQAGYVGFASSGNKDLYITNYAGGVIRFNTSVVNYDSMLSYGDFQINKANAWLTLKSSGTGGTGVEQAAGISIGESGYKGSAALHLTYTGDGYGHIGMGTVSPTTSLPAKEVLKLYYQSNTAYFLGDISEAGALLSAKYLSKAAPYVGLSATGSGTYPCLTFVNNPCTSSSYFRCSDGAGFLPYASNTCYLGTNSWRFGQVHSLAFYRAGQEIDGRYSQIGHSHPGGEINPMYLSGSFGFNYTTSRILCTPNLYLEVKPTADSYGIIIRDSGGSDYGNLKNVNGVSYLGDGTGTNSLMIAISGTGVTFPGTVNAPQGVTGGTRVHVYQSTNIANAMLNNTDSIVQFGSNIQDSLDEWHSSYFQPKSSGFYLIHANVTVNVLGGIHSYLSIYIGSSRYCSTGFHQPDKGGYITIPITAVLSLTTSSAVRIKFTHDAITNKDLIGGLHLTYFCACRVA